MDYIEIFIDEKRLSLSPGTIRQYSLILHNFRVYTGKPVEASVKHDIVKYLNYLMFEKKLSRTTVSNVLSIIKSFYSFMIENEYVAVNPARGIDNIKSDKKAPVYLTIQEVDDLFNAAIDPKDNIMVKMLYATGVRVSELVNIKKKDVDLDRTTINVFGKGAKERVVLIPDSIKSQLEAYFHDLDGEQKLFDMTTRTVERDIKTLAARAGINKKVTPHKLRHSFATHMLQNGGNVVAIQKLLGHTSLNTTQIYTHYSVDELRDMYAHTHPMSK